MGRPPGWVTAKTGRAPMPSPGRPPVSSREERRRFWSLIAQGLSSEQAALQVGVSAPVGSRWFRHAGGMSPLPLAPLSGRYLTLQDREDIAASKAAGKSVRAIAKEIGRSPSTVSRELRRNAASRGGKLEYRASVAQWHSEVRARRPKQSKLEGNEQLRQYVQDRLSGVIARPDGRPVTGPTVKWIGRRHGRRADRWWAKAWSPEQIAGRLPLEFPDDESMRVSHEAIYQPLYVQGRGVLRQELTACLRTGAGSSGAAGTVPAAQPRLRQQRGTDIGSAPQRSRTARSQGTGRAT